LTEQNGRGAAPARNGVGRELEPQTVLLLCKEPDEREVFDRALGDDQRLIVATGAEELGDELDSPADTIIIDLPASERRNAWERVRARHSGMVLVAVDDPDEARDWPPDLARRFLVRPLHTEEVAAALAVRPRILREPAAARRRRLERARRPPVIPPPVPTAALPPPPEAIEPPRRLSSEESLWEEPQAEAEAAAGADAPAPGADAAEAEAAPERPTGAAPSPAAGRRRSLLTVAVAVALLAATAVGGIAIGRATASPDQRPRADTPATGTPAPSASTAAPGVVKEKTPAACDAALADADAALSYLVGNVRDQRLTEAMQRYQEHRSACRQAVR
jgi:hypothetical protein